MRITTPLGPVLVIGEVLFDVFPDQRRLGGAPFNFAWHLHHLGVKVNFISRVGDDDSGAEILDFARQAGFPTEGIQVDPDHPTGEVRVTMEEGGGHRFEILPERAYDFLEPGSWLQTYKRNAPAYVYFGSLIQRGPVASATVQEVVRWFRTRSTFVIDLNLRAPFYNREVVERTLNTADLLKLNDEELIEVSRLFDWKGGLEKLAAQLLAHFRVGNLCLTRGDRGSLWFAAGQPQPWRCSGFGTEEFVDSVGAGDAFAAMMALGFLVDWPRLSVLERASAFAARVCSIPGALPSDPEFYQPYRFQ